MLSNRPLVSILIPVFNRANIIAETITSALSQTYENIEIIIVDNASTDDTWLTICSYAEKHPQLKVFQNESNLGPVRNWQSCVEKASGELGKILWSDDLISPDFIEKTIPYFENDQVGFVYTAAKIFADTPDKGTVVHRNSDSGIYDTELFIQGDLNRKGFPVSPGCAIFYLEDIKKNLKLDIPNSINSDFSMHAIGNDLLLFLLTANKYQKYGHVAQPLAFFRSHADSISIKSTSGKLPLHYQVARAYYIENYRKDLIEELNAHLYIDLRKHPKSKEFGLYSVADFYVEKINTRVKPSKVIKILASKLLSKILLHFK
ncbi:MAG: glycosyltransferase family 2 protein [Pseudomonas sp.]|nr:glycosyltransferase family 2 protein [Pseudomonas sp.]